MDNHKFKFSLKEVKAAVASMEKNKNLTAYGLQKATEEEDGVKYLTLYITREL